MNKYHLLHLDQLKQLHLKPPSLETQRPWEQKLRRKPRLVKKTIPLIES
jgi:hypothetical protein